MLKIVLRFGLIAGAFISTVTSIMVPMCASGEADFSNSEVVGYSAMVLAFLLVFFGVRSYRDNVAQGALGFWRAFQVGILITLVTCAMYVLTWEIIYFNFLPNFFELYSAKLLEQLRASGATEAAIQQQATELAEFGKQYSNPLFNAAVTFMEIFPVGLILTLVSAAILRRSPAPAAAVES